MNKQFAFFKTFGLGLIFSLLTSICFADISVKLSQPKVGVNESFTLVFTASDNPKTGPDFSPLTQNFEIHSTSQNQSYSFINGAASHETQWKLVLTAPKEGQFTIPSIKFGNEESTPLQIEISGSPIVKNDESLFLETEISPQEFAYDRTQILYTVRLFCSVNLGQANLSEPQSNDPDMIIARLGNDNRYEFYHQNGTRYLVFERKYAVFPQHAGELIFSPIIFSGQVVQGNSFFNMQSQHKQVQSDSRQIEIKPIPAPFTKSDWFAAYDVKLSEEWSSDLNKVIIGEPITWTLTINAEGCLSNLIPDIILNIPDDVKQYRDKTETSDKEGTRGMLGTKQIKIALIPNREGEIHLPEIELNWWDLNTNEVKTLHLPAKIMHVQKDPLTVNSIASNEEIRFSQPQETLNENSFERFPFPIWVWGLMIINIVWSAILTIFSLKKRPKKIVKSKSINPSNREVSKLLKQACLSGNAKEAEKLLLSWAAIQYPNEKVYNLAGIKKYLSEPFREAVEDLNKTLYSLDSTWNGNALWQAFKVFTPNAPKQSTTLVELENPEGLYRI